MPKLNCGDPSKIDSKLGQRQLKGVKIKKLISTISFLIGAIIWLPADVKAQTCVQADINHPETVTLTWQDNSTDESGFIVERKQDAGTFAVIAAALAPDTKTYTDTSVKRAAVAVTYTYRVKAFRSSDKTESAASNESCITFAAVLPPQPPILSAPGGLTLSAISSSSFRVTWDDSGFPGYLLEGKLAKGNDTFTQIAYLPPGTASYDWTGRKRFTSYCVRLRGDKADAEYTPISCATSSK